MRDAIAELINRPVSTSDVHAIKLLVGLFFFSLPLGIYYALPNGASMLAEVFTDTELRHSVEKFYPLVVAFFSAGTLFLLASLAVRGSKVGLVGSTLLASAGVLIFVSAF